MEASLILAVAAKGDNERDYRSDEIGWGGEDKCQSGTAEVEGLQDGWEDLNVILATIWLE